MSIRPSFIGQLLLLFLIHFSSKAACNVVATRIQNRQIRLHVGDTLRLECPIWSSEAPHVENVPDGAHFLDGGGVKGMGIMYQWNIKDLPDYSVSMHPHFSFTEGGRVVEVTGQVTKDDAGLYKCSGVTGFGKKEVTFEVHIADMNDDLLCAKAIARTNDPRQMLCFMNPNLRSDKVTTIEALLGSSVDMNCQAIGMQPVKYLWFMGNSVADWISGGQGVRGPRLHIEKVGREHTGHYTCQVKNSIGSLNYTYRLTVKEPLSAIPTIIGALENQTFIGGTSGTLICRIKCTCAEPIIQWLKRVEPHEKETYHQKGKSLVPLPTPRETEAGELYVALEKWINAAAFMEETYQQEPGATDLSEHELQSFQREKAEYAVPEHLFNAMRRTEERIFVSRLQLKAPISRERHAGKYVVMTMNRANLKQIEYDTVFVTVTSKSFNPSAHNIVVYFVIPTSFMLLAIFGSIYFFLNRRSLTSQSGLRNAGSHTTFNHPSIFSGSSGKKDLGAYQNIANTHSLTTNTRSYSHSNGIPPTLSLPLSGGDNSSNRSDLKRFPPKSMQPYSQSDSTHSLQLQVGYPTQLTEQNLLLAQQQQPQQPLPQPPSNLYYSGISVGQTGVTYAPQPSYWGRPAPSVATEMSFDQYSAVAHTGPGSSQSTNHYMSPFPDFPIMMKDNSETNSSQGPPFAFPPT